MIECPKVVRYEMVANSRRSTETGGLIVADKVQLRIYTPLQPDGRAFATVSITARALSAICSGVKEILPTGT